MLFCVEMLLLTVSIQSEGHGDSEIGTTVLEKPINGTNNGKSRELEQNLPGKKQGLTRDKGEARMKRTIARLLLVSMIVLALTGCTSKMVSDAQPVVVNWEESTHSNSVEPDYDAVFNQSKVLEFTITIDSEDWEAMQQDLEENLLKQDMGADRPIGDRQPFPEGAIGESLQDTRPAGGRPPLPEGGIGGNLQDGMPVDARQPLANNLMETPSDSTYDPIWVEASVTFEDSTWDHVGIRYKGNSSLRSAVSSGNNKLSFKLDFDEFEDTYPEIKNQRLYGFKQLNLNNNYSDESLMREKVSSDLFKEFGVPSANTAFCVVYVDHGEGSQFFGVYTLVEEMDDTGIENQFGDDSGNLYKPDGTAASFASGTYNDEEMVKKSNESEEDYSDVKALYDVINSAERETDTEAWKADVEEVFDVEGFLKWLAANTVMQNWDTYGNMTHNYFLYTNPETNKLEWIPWDNNEALSAGKGNRGALSLGLDEVSDEWPLIAYLMNEPEYKTMYDRYVYQFAQDAFTEEKMVETYSKYFEMLQEYAYAEKKGYSYISSDQSFDAAVEILKSHVIERNEAVASYVKNSTF